jgi:gamma-glutamyl:cysteine ligase YbdK (ATP-grasp superfamily)
MTEHEVEANKRDAAKDALDAKITAAKTKRNIKLAAMDAEIAALELELAAMID